MMSDRQRHTRLGRLLTAVLALLAVGVMGAGLAWACTEKAELGELNPSSGPADTEVTVSGSHLPPGGRVDVRLDAEDGPLLGSRAVDENGDFSDLKVKIPDLPPDVYNVIAFGYNAAGELRGDALRTFEVTGPGGDGGPPQTDEKDTPGGDAGSGSGVNIFAPGGNGAPNVGGGTNPPGQEGTGNSPGRGTTTSGGRGTANTPGRGARMSGVSPATSRSGASTRPNTSTRPATTGSTASGGIAATRRAGAASPNGGGSGHVTAPSSQPIFKDSLPPSVALPNGRSFGQPSGRSASGDLWSGFGSGRTPSLEPRRSLPAGEGGGFDIGLGAGIGFLAVGLVALYGSFLVAEVRRRRKPVRVNAPRR